jgi:hypothetical protein
MRRIAFTVALSLVLGAGCSQLGGGVQLGSPSAHSETVRDYLLRERSEAPEYGLYSDAAVAWLLDHYDYARARQILLRFQGNYRSGPYIVSSLKPLSGELSGDRFLWQDMSHADPSLSHLWMRHFLTQSAKSRFWEPDALRRWGLEFRNAVALAAEELPKVREQLAIVIEMVRAK